jgi:serine/threonine protein kinase
VIIDFGLSRHLELKSVTPTIQGAWIGTFPYFAPEQITGTRHSIDHRTDLFALGVMLYQTLTGIHPFLASGMDGDDLSESICQSDKYLETTEYQQLPARWQSVLQRLLQKERARRPPSAEFTKAMISKAEG